MSRPKIEKLKIFGCPEGCRKKFDSENGLNNHLTKVHEVTYKVRINKGRAYTVTKLNLKRAQILV